jgi:hypothetical protein
MKISHGATGSRRIRLDKVAGITIGRIVNDNDGYPDVIGELLSGCALKRSL